jgi:hypothetical protein
MSGWKFWLPSPFLVGVIAGSLLYSIKFDNSWKGVVIVGLIFGVGGAIADKIERWKTEDYIRRQKK